MSIFAEQIFRLDQGVDVYRPDVTSSELLFKRLQNLQPYRGRLTTARGFTEATETLGGRVLVFIFCTEPYSLYSSLFAITTTGIYTYDFVADAFEETAIYTWPSGSPPIAAVSWYDKVYATRKGAGLVRLVGNVAAVVPDAPGGRYLALSNSHLMVANLASGNQNYPNRVRWSDLYLPEDFEITEDSEADYFELEPGDGEITGLSYQRGNNLIYTRVSVWIARYNPLPIGYKFDPLYSDVGCNFHGGHVSVRERDYFIGVDNVYMIDGLQLVEIGDEIWKFFKEDCATNASTGYLVTRVDKEKHSIAWIYDKLGGGNWSIVYNYKERKWSDRDPMGVFASLYLPYPLRGFIPINDVLTNFDDPPNTTNMIDGDWQFPLSTLAEAHGGNDGGLFINNTAFDVPAQTGIQCQAVTYEFFADSLFDEKEFDVLCMHYSGGGRPNVRLEVGTRGNRLDQVVWSTPLEMWNQLESETVFFFRREGLGKLVQFRFTWENSATNYIEELTNLSLKKLEDGPNTPEK